MKFLIYLSFFTLLFSCASIKNPRALKEAELDGLKFESLARYSPDRLSKLPESKEAIALCRKTEYNKAIEILRSKLDENLRNYQYWNEISTCYILKKEYTQARKFLDIAMSTTNQNSQKSVLLNNMGVIYLENSNYFEAKEHFKKAIELNNKLLSPKFNLSQVYMKFGLYGKAKKEVGILLKQNSQDVDFLNAWAYINLMENDYKEALLYFNKIPSQYRSRDDIATNMAMTYFMLGLYDSAKISLNNADKKDSLYSNSQNEIEKRIEKVTEKR